MAMDFSTLIATATPAKSAKGGKVAEPTARLDGAATDLGAGVRSALMAAGVAAKDLPSAAKVTTETTALIVGTVTTALGKVATAAATGAKGTKADGVTLKAKRDTKGRIIGGRAVVTITPDLGDGVWGQASVSVTFDGPIGDAILGVLGLTKDPA